METNEIINYLHKEYYLKDSTPHELVSSFWKYCQNQQKVQIKNGEVEALIATPHLGGLDIKSPVYRFLGGRPKYLVYKRVRRNDYINLGYRR